MVDIPSKNISNKERDADVIAIFENLKLVLYIQAKFYEDKANKYAVEQINDYRNYASNDDDGYPHIAWVITTADEYNEEALKLATENNIILITGIQFAEMLLNVGFSGMDI
ncbi:restriction endonuclease [Helicobacter sp.]|uniref:restriction endonuclease n=1 Tax=Helicobacter sp. TaxID=218 RepID=UPI0019A93093|nr:restriction endonuclease [Helicobacter sp.]MBD5164972.1 restriction endonuclease [Helicobacter sp.]